MTRSFWKIPFIHYKLLDDIIKKNNFIKTHSRASIIIESFIGRTILVYNGHKYKKVLITENMVGHKLGEFAYTRKIGIIHSDKFERRIRK